MSEDQQDRFQPRYQVLAYSLEKIVHPKIDRSIRTAIHKSFQHELESGGAAYGKHRIKHMHIYTTSNGRAVVDKTHEQGLKFSIFCDNQRPAAEFRAGSLAYKALRAIYRWLKPPMALLALADGKEVQDLVEVSVNYAEPGEHPPFTPGPIALHYENGAPVQQSLEHIKELEQRLIDEYLFANDGKENASVRTRIGTLWHSKHGILSGLIPGVFPPGLEPRILDYTLAIPLTAARTGTDPPTGATPSP